MTDHKLEERSLFLQVVELATDEERSSFLDAACGDNSRLRREIEALLRAHEGSFGLLDAPDRDLPTVDQPPITEGPGTLIGPYKLRELIGEGGMGVVYVAEQSHPVRRKVALKVIKPGMDTKQVVARFEAERQALAMMDHSNIAKVHDGGTTESGRPYFVMELVPGVPITEYCDGERLSVCQRLELFVLVCRAVQHAHQKGVIHRDLKPSNILVTLHDGVPVPKVIDFGVAKAMGQSLTDKTVYTALSQLVGTPLYMSPEQAEMNQLGVDTRSDVYSLGVLLYELLTGTTPFDKEILGKSSLEEMRRIIREVEPPRPSARVSARLRKDEGGRMKDEKKTSPSVSSSSRLGRSSFIFHPSSFQELDWIVMKSLEKDRGRRYESASAFATDIQRYLDDEPVLAGPPSTMYKFHKFARKHRGALATAVAIAASLILGTTASAWQAVRATTAEAQANANATQAQEKAREATTQRDEARALNDRLQRTLYAAHMNLAQHAWEAGGADRVRELLELHRPKAGETDLRGFEWYYLYRLCHAELLTLEGHSVFVLSVAYSPDGKRLATGCTGGPGGPRRLDNSDVRVWDAQTGQELLSLKGAGFHVTFSPDGKRLASASHGPVKVWDVQTGQELLTIEASPASDTNLAFSPDGKNLARGSKVWDVQTGQELLSLKHGGVVSSMAYSPDGKRLATASWGHTVKVWDAQTGQELLAFKGHADDWVYGVAFNPDGKRLASVGARALKVWDARTGEELLTLSGRAGQFGSVAFSPDGKRVASPSDANVVSVWDAQTGQELFTFKGHSNRITEVAFSPDGKHLASAAFDRTVRVWDAQTVQEPLTLEGAASSINGVAFSPDGKRLAGASRDETVKVWDARTGQELLTLKGLTTQVSSVAFSADGKRLAGAAWDRTKKEGVVKVWEAQTGEELLSRKGHTGGVNSVVFSPDGKRLASGSAENGVRNTPPFVRGEVKVWDAQTGQELFSLQGNSNSVAFSPDGTRLASGSGFGPARPGEVKVWDAQTGQELLTLKGHTASVTSVAFSPDGKCLASGSGSQFLGGPSDVKVWEAQTGQELLSLKHLRPVSSVAFSPNGRRLATASADKTVKVWDTETGSELLTVPGGGGLAFSPDGHRLASGTERGTVTIYDATPRPQKP